MVTYFDASVILRLVLGQAGSLSDRPIPATGVTSALTEVECLRTLDRLRFGGTIPDAALTVPRMAIYRLIRPMDTVAVTPGILRRAADPFATPLGTLDAIHLATALAWRDETGESPVMATHDAALGLAAQAHGLEVIGVR